MADDTQRAGVGKAGAAFLAGFGCMAAELTAVRLLAPHFGDSAYVWTNVIGVILVALALGAVVGGRLAGRPDADRWPSRLLLASALLLAVVPFVVGGLGAFLVPGDLPLDSAMPAMVRGSLAVSALLFVPPMALLGAVSPLLVVALVRGGQPVGQAAGWISAAGTIGSLAGTFSATHWLVPTFGSRATFLVAASLLVVGAALAHWPRSARLGGVAGLLWLSALLLPQPLRSVQPGERLLAEQETSYQFLQVVRSEATPARTFLRINEGLDSFHSLAVDGSALTGGAYYDWHALAPWLVAAAPPDGLRALSIGDAAGSLRRMYAAVHPQASVDGVDLDGATMALGDEHFPGRQAPGRRYAADGRWFIERATERWHVIHVDAYAHQVYIPAHLASREFFRAARARLEDGGVLACNVGALHDQDPVLRAIGTTLAEVFGHAFALQVPASRNFLLVARRGAAPSFDRWPTPPSASPSLTPDDAAAVQSMLAYAAEPRRWRDVAAGGELLGDDRPVLDQLLHRSYVATEDPGEAMQCTGKIDPAGAELAAYEARKAADWLGVLRAVGESRAPTAYLRELAGDARWTLRQLQAAAAEYTAARQLAEDAAARERLGANLAALSLDLEAQRNARSVASRNGWLELGVLSTLVAAGWLTLRRC